MYRVLFLPLLQMPSGHHHVADCIQQQLEELSWHSEKVDVLSYCYPKLERMVTSIYLQWIHRFPGLYSSVYRYSAVRGRTDNRMFQLCERLFLDDFLQMLEHKRPDLCICTHAFPSYLLARLKKSKRWRGKAVNIYTDYFINDLWGGKEIDFHFVPDLEFKSLLLKKGLKSSQLIHAGIPVHPIFKQMKSRLNTERQIKVLISGGNMGAGPIQAFLRRLRPTGDLFYYVLCGKNNRLFQFVKQLNEPLIQPLAYISSKAEMNELYNKADLIITKPGGVTISECLSKQLPVFIYDALPGQEEQNLLYLKKKGLVHHLKDWQISENPEIEIIEHYRKSGDETAKNVTGYANSIEIHDPVSVIASMLKN